MKKNMMCLLSLALAGAGCTGERLSNDALDDTAPSSGVTSVSSTSSPSSASTYSQSVSQSSSHFSSDSLVKMSEGSSSSDFAAEYIEAEDFMDSNDVSPFVIEVNAEGPEVFLVCRSGQGLSPGPDETWMGRVSFPVIARQSSLQFHAVVNFASSDSDSFYYRLKGATQWRTQNQQTTLGFEQIKLHSDNNIEATFDALEIGGEYSFEIQCREDGAMIDGMYVLGGEFGGAGNTDDMSSTHSMSSSESSFSSQANAIAGEMAYVVYCQGCHGDRGQGTDKGARIVPHKNTYHGLSLITYIEAEMNFCFFDGCAADIAAFINNGLDEN